MRKILVPTDGSDASARAVQAALALAQALRGSVLVLHAAPPFHGGAYGTADNARRMLAEVHAAKAGAAAGAILDAARADARAAGVPCEALAVESERPWEAIVAAARRRRCDMICMASHGRHGLAGVVLGSETAKVLTHCTLPVLVLR